MTLDGCDVSGFGIAVQAQTTSAVPTVVRNLSCHDAGTGVATPIAVYGTSASIVTVDGLTCDASVNQAIAADTTAVVNVGGLGLNVDAAANLVTLGAGTPVVRIGQVGGATIVPNPGGAVFLPYSAGLATTVIATGALTSNLAIVTPNVPGLSYTVLNLTSGAFTVTIEPIGGAGFVVPQYPAAGSVQTCVVDNTGLMLKS